VLSGRASNAMGISALAFLLAMWIERLFGNGSKGHDPDRPAAKGRSGISQWRSNDKTAIQGGTRSSLVIAGRGPAKQKCSLAILSRTDLDHDVSILITAEEVAGRERGEAPRRNVSMMIMRPPQHGHGCESGLDSAASAQQVTPASGCAAGTSRMRRARAMLSARVPLASRP